MTVFHEVGYLYKQHCVEGVRIRCFSGPNFPVFGLSTGPEKLRIRILSTQCKLHCTKKWNILRLRKKIAAFRSLGESPEWKISLFCIVTSKSNKGILMSFVLVIQILLHFTKCLNCDS